ncbi:MAG: RNA polymerase subunit sigma-24 [Gemmatimonadetes bacterium]|nr:MAG: RNA polymerase subunit sigma-24 [Gemmatimonadota bacterium]
MRFPRRYRAPGPRRLRLAIPTRGRPASHIQRLARCDARSGRVGTDKVETSDADLVRRVLAGDTRAYAGLVARYRDRLGRYAMHMLGDREDAEEALQDAFVRGYRSLARCYDPERFGAWLYGILVNRCRTTGARAARRGRVFVRDEGALNGVPHPSAAERTEWEDAVHRALARLAPEYREAFLLKHVEDLEYETMARLTGAGVSALKMRVKRAREQLQVILREAERV